MIVGLYTEEKVVGDVYFEDAPVKGDYVQLDEEQYYIVEILHGIREEKHFQPWASKMYALIERTRDEDVFQTRLAEWQPQQEAEAFADRLENLGL